MQEGLEQKRQERERLEKEKFVQQQVLFQRMKKELLQKQHGSTAVSSASPSLSPIPSSSTTYFVQQQVLFQRMKKELLQKRQRSTAADPALPSLSPTPSSSTIVHNVTNVRHGDVHTTEHIRHSKLLCCFGCCKHCNEPCKDMQCRWGCNPC